MIIKTTNITERHKKKFKICMSYLLAENCLNRCHIVECTCYFYFGKMKTDYISSDKIVEKHVLQFGSVQNKPTEGARCNLTIKNIEILPDNLNLSALHSVILSSAPEVCMTVGEVDFEVDRQIERAIKWMGVQEEAFIVINLPVNNQNDKIKISFNAKLIKVDETSPIWAWSPEEKYSRAFSYKEMAVKLVQAGRTKDAFWRFSKAVKLLITLEPINDLELKPLLLKNINDLRTNLYNNMAMCQLKFNNYSHVISLCSKVLERDENNVKARYRRGCAYGGVKDIEKALIDFEKAVHLEPNNVAAREKMKFFSELWDNAIKRRDELYKKMIQL